MEKKPVWGTTKKAVFFAVGLVLVLAFAVKYAVASNASNATVVNKTALNVTAVNANANATIGDIITQLMREFKIENMTVQGECAYIVAEGNLTSLQIDRVDAFITWCNNGTIYLTAKAKIHR